MGVPVTEETKYNLVSITHLNGLKGNNVPNMLAVNKIHDNP